MSVCQSRHVQQPHLDASCLCNGFLKLLLSIDGHAKATAPSSSSSKGCAPQQLHACHRRVNVLTPSVTLSSSGAQLQLYLLMWKTR